MFPLGLAYFRCLSSMLQHYSSKGFKMISFTVRSSVYLGLICVELWGTNLNLLHNGYPVVPIPFINYSILFILIWMSPLSYIKYPYKYNISLFLSCLFCSVGLFIFSYTRKQYSLLRLESNSFFLSCVNNFKTFFFIILNP